MAKSPLSALGSLGSFGSILNVLREVDVRPARIAAETPFVLAFASRDVPFAEYLAALMYRGDRPADVPPYRAAVGVPLTATAQISRAHLVVIVTRSGDAADEELAVKRALESSGVPVLMCFLEESGALPPVQHDITSGNAVTLPLINGTLDERAAVKRLTQAVRQLKAIDDLALARFLPAFREPVVQALIEDVAVANAAYSFGTGILEVNPVTGLPLTVADTVILTKNQGIMAYKIALAMGMPPDFKHIMPQIAGVIGGGFIMRQIARSLVGLIPGLGILPKVGIAFAGTYAIGEAVYVWCRSGEKLTEDGLAAVYRQALQRGKAIAASLRRQREQAAGRRAERCAERRAERRAAREAAPESGATDATTAAAPPETIIELPVSPRQNGTSSQGDHGVSPASY